MNVNKESTFGAIFFETNYGGVGFYFNVDDDNGKSVNDEGQSSDHYNQTIITITGIITNIYNEYNYR